MLRHAHVISREVPKPQLFQFFHLPNQVAVNKPISDNARKGALKNTTHTTKRRGDQFRSSPSEKKRNRRHSKQLFL